MLVGGHSLTRAFERISAHDDGGTGTGSKLLNAVLDYYSSWVGRDADRPSGPPTLVQAIRAERERYLEMQRPDDVKPAGHWINPYGGAQQSLAGVDEFGFAQFTNLRSASGRFVVAGLRPAPAVLSWLPITLRNAVRLHVAAVRATWYADWADEFPPRPGERGALRTRLEFTLTGAGPDIRLGVIHSESQAMNCGGDDPYSAAEQLRPGLGRSPRLPVLRRGIPAARKRPDPVRAVRRQLGLRPRRHGRRAAGRRPPRRAPERQPRPPPDRGRHAHARRSHEGDRCAGRRGARRRCAGAAERLPGAGPAAGAGDRRHARAAL